MFVKLLRTLSTPDGELVEGHVYDVPDSHALAYISNGVAIQTDMPVEFASDFYADRLNPGAGEKCLFLPFVGEFGHLVMSHIRIVHWHKAAYKIVCCRPGEEVLFPSADEFVTDWVDPIPDMTKIGTMRKRNLDWEGLIQRFPGARPIYAGNLSPSQELIAIHPDKAVPLKSKPLGYHADVCLGVRSRMFCPERNWPHWQQLANAIIAAGYTVAVVGRRDTAPDLVGQSYHTDGDTNSAIELLRNCQLYIGQDSGNSHLAATVGALMLIFREEDGGSRNLVPRMKEVNSDIVYLPDAWGTPEKVIAETLSLLTPKGGIAHG